MRAGKPSPPPVMRRPSRPRCSSRCNPAMGDRVRGAAIAALGPVAGRRVWDLYAGIGETTSALTEAGAVVESVESDPLAVAEAETRGPPAHRHAGRVELVLGRLLRPDLVVTNPPRVGMDERVTAGLERPRRRGSSTSPAIRRRWRATSPDCPDTGSPRPSRSTSFPRRRTSRRSRYWTGPREVHRDGRRSRHRGRGGWRPGDRGREGADGHAASHSRHPDAPARDRWPAHGAGHAERRARAMESGDPR